MSRGCLMHSREAGSTSLHTFEAVTRYEGISPVSTSKPLDTCPSRAPPVLTPVKAWLPHAELEHVALQVVCLDEATASIDADTDALLQQTVSAEFAGSTLLIIAHRLHTIIDADAVLVMERGAAAEFGLPAKLLSDEDGVFSSAHQT